ncbi:MAG: hypothetical protein R3F62_13490 [Planctomycetota bacterium]
MTNVRTQRDSGREGGDRPAIPQPTDASSGSPEGHARAWAAEILETRWAPVRYRLELEDERWRTTPWLERPHYQARFRVWELAGLCRVEDGRSARFPADPERLVELAQRAEPPQDPLLAAEALRRAEATFAKPRRLRVRGRVEERTRWGTTRWFVLESTQDDAQVVIDYDPEAQRRLGYLCGPFFRGSHLSAALSKEAALRKARQVLGIPAQARAGRAALVKTAWGRVWRLRWEVETPAEVGVITASLNARSGSVCVFFTTVLPRPQLLGPHVPTPERALREIRRAARESFGPGAVVGEPVQAAVEAEGAPPRAAWVAVVRAPDRSVYRARLDGSDVQLLPTA